MEKASFQHANVLIGGVKDEISHLKETIEQALGPRDNNENHPPVHSNIPTNPGVIMYHSIHSLLTIIPTLTDRPCFRT